MVVGRGGVTDARPSDSMSIVRDNLMTQPGYTPYCGGDDCTLRWPRTRFDGKQFACSCGWHTTFEDEFIESYKAKWQKERGVLTDA